MLDLRKIQAGTGLLVAVFLAVHLANTWLAALGPAAYDGFQLLARAVYQWLPVEVALLSAIAVHGVVGVTRIVREPKRVLSPRARVHRYAGFFLMAVIVGHVLAVRGASWFFDVYPGFRGLAFTLDYLPGYFYPYYLLLGLAGFYHGCNGVGIALKRLGLKSEFRIPSRELGFASAFAGIGMVAALLGMGGVLFEITDVYQSEFAKLVLDLIGQTETAVARRSE